MTNAPPSSNPANKSNLTGVMDVILGKFARDLKNMIPAQVLSFDRQANRATVKPLILIVSTENQDTESAEVDDVPVFQCSGGGFVINFPLKVGDIGWLHACDSDISIFKQAYSQSRPNTFRKHSFEDSVFYPDVMRGWVVDDNDGLVIQTLSGNQKINILDDEIRIRSDNKILLDAPLIEITGVLRSGTTSGGEAVFAGNVTATGEIKTMINNIELSTHKHTGVQPGSGETDGPTS